MKSEQASGSDKARAGVVTAKQVESASVRAKRAGRDIWLTDAAARGAGRFMVRCTAAGSAVGMFRYMRGDGRRDTLKVSDIDLSGVAGLTLAEARAKAGEWARLLQSGVTDDLRTHFAAAEQAEKARTEGARSKAEAERQQAERGSLKNLLDAYVVSLGERPSAADARNIFKLHIIEPFPQLATAPAASITPRQFSEVLRRLVDANKGRTAAKLRAFAAAAYSLAMRAALDPTLPVQASQFGVEVNPLTALPSLSQFNKARERDLTLSELHAFWKRLQALPESAARDAVIASLLTGGQRPTQLLRLTKAHVDLAAGTLTLFDPKGKARSNKPRTHVVPVVAELAPLIERRMKLCTEPESPIFSTDGTVALRVETLSNFVTAIVGAMAEANELERGAFQLRDLRRTCETQLAALGVSRDVRAVLLSHGLSGVQAKHYDRHDYMSEKRHALTLWAARVTGAAADVVPITSRREAAAA